MSIQAVGWVLDHSTAEKSPRLVLLALANHAGADGRRAFPSVATLAHEARLSERAVQTSLRRLENDGHIEGEGYSISGTRAYRILMPENGVSHESAGCRICTPPQKRGSISHESAPEPSVNRSEPSTRSNDLVLSHSVGGKRVDPDKWDLAERVLGEFNRQAGRKLRLLTSAGQPSEAAKRIYGRLAAYPDIGFDEHAEIIRRTLASRWWGDGPPSVGVVYGPKVFEENITRPGARSSTVRGSRGFVIDAEALERRSREAAGG